MKDRAVDTSGDVPQDASLCPWCSGSGAVQKVVSGPARRMSEPSIKQMFYRCESCGHEYDRIQILSWPTTTPPTPPESTSGPTPPEPASGYVPDSLQPVIIWSAILTGALIAGSLWQYEKITARREMEARFRREVHQALVETRRGSREPLKAILRDWSRASAAVALLTELHWTPTTPDEVVYVAVARRDGTTLRQQWETTSEVLSADLYYTTSYAPLDPRTENAMYALIGIGNAEALDLLHRRLLSSGSVALAEAYANAGHPRLYAAADEWARRNGYVLKTVSGSPSLQWGAFR